MPALALLLAAFLDAPLEARIARVLEPELKSSPGIAAAISKDGNVVYRRGLGFADLAKTTAASSATRFKIGSLSKAFTAALVQKLAADGELSLDDSIAKFFPAAPEAWKAIAVRDLLQHTSGLVSYADLMGIMLRTSKPGTQDEIVKAVASQKVKFSPGERFDYSNTNYNLLGLIAEKIGGAPLETQLKARIFDPLGMKSTTLERSGWMRVDEAQGSMLKASAFAPARPIDMSWPYAAGSVVSTADDMIRWLDGLETSVLTKEQQKEAFAPRLLKDGTPSFYGFGWGLSTRGNEPMFCHAGSINGYSSYALRLPLSKVSLVLLTNAGDWSRIQPLALRLLAAYEGREAPAGIVDGDVKLTNRLRRVVDALLEGKRDPAEFDAAFLKVVPEAQWKATGESLAALGPVAEFQLIAVEGSRRDYTLLVGPARLTASFTLGTDGKITGMLLK